MNKMNKTEEKPIKIAEAELEQVVGGITLWELMKEACQQVKGIVDLNKENSDDPNHDTDAAQK